MHPRDLQRFQTVAQRVVTAIAAVRGHTYTPEPSVDLYPTTGTHSDYAYSRHIANPSVRKTYGYTFETGPWQGSVAESFHPADPEPIKREAESGLIALVQQCICAIELIGLRLLERDDEVDSLRHVRDDLLATTDAGRAWIALFERIQTPLIGSVLDDERLVGRAAELLTSAGALVGDETSVLGPEVAQQARDLVAELAERAPDEHRGDLRAVSDALVDLEGRSTPDVIRALMSQAPRSRGTTAD